MRLNTANIAKIIAFSSAVILLFAVAAERYPASKADSRVVSLAELQENEVFPLLLDGDNDKDAVSTIGGQFCWTICSSSSSVSWPELVDSLEPSSGPRYLRGPPCV